MKAMNHKIAAGLGLLFAAFLWLVAITPPGHAASQCGDRDALIAILADRYGETPRGIGLTADSRLFEIFASDATGTWTAMTTKAGEPTCLVASGQGWQDILPMAVPPGTEG